MKKNGKMGAFDLFLFNVVSVFGIAWFTSAAKMGPSQIFLWILAALLFFITESFIVTELSTTWPLEGGLSAWAAEAFGSKTGFLTSWIYLLQNIIYFPAFLITAATFFSYFICKPFLADNKIYMLIFCMILMWGVTFLNIKGFNISKIINRFGAVFSFGIISLLIILALYWVFGLHQPVQTHYTLKSMIPDFSNLKSIVFFSTMLFAFAGMEAPASLMSKIENPKKDFPKAILLSAIILPFLWIIGTTSLTIVMSPSKIGLVSGMINVIDVVCKKANIGWFVSIVGLFLFLFRIGSVNVWTLSPIVMFLGGSKGYMPEWLTKTDEKTGTPKNALIIQAVLVSILTFMSCSMPTMESAYWLISAMATICLFIVFLVLFASFIKLRIKEPDVKRGYKVPCGKLMASVAFCIVFASTILALLPPDGINVGALIKYEAELIGGPIIFIAIGYIFYWIYKKKNTSENKSVQG